jgi:hypothetical protein
MMEGVWQHLKVAAKLVNMKAEKGEKTREKNGRTKKCI